MDASRLEELYLESYELETTELTPTHRTDLRTEPPDVYVEHNFNPGAVSWPDLGPPLLITNYSTQRSYWEQTQAREMPTFLQWKYYNRNLHTLFNIDYSKRRDALKKKIRQSLLKLQVQKADESLQELIKLRVWNHLHQKEDAFWDPRGKRKLFEGLEVKNPRILVLGAADGYDAMVLLSLYPNGHATLVDYDDFCLSHRFREFPEDYPFLGKDPKTGYWNVYNKEDFNIHYEVGDIQTLKYGREFDIVLSPGLIEHYSDKYKPLAFHFHRQFLKPGGYAIMLSTHNQVRIRSFYQLVGDLLNFSYRELMTAPQLAMYAHENGFKILKCAHIKAHNCVIAKEK